MPDASFSNRYKAWYAWYRSGGGPFAVGGEPFAIPNYNYQYNAAYSHAGALTTLSEGQSYGLLYALMADNLADFQKIFLITLDRHRLTAANIAASKDQYLNAPWGTEQIAFMSRTGQSTFDAGRTSLNIFGWVTSNDYSSNVGAQRGLSSVFAAPDGDVVFVAACLMAYERWGFPDYRDYALASLPDMADWCTLNAVGRAMLTMGQYRYDGGGFSKPALLDFNAATAPYLGPPSGIIASTEYYTTGDAIRFFRPSGSTLPEGLTGQDAIGAVWPRYFIRVVDPFNFKIYTTQANAIADTSPVVITAAGSGSITVIPYSTAKGLVATDPSYLFPLYFRQFAKYDLANSAMWNTMAANAYGDILYSMNTLSTYKTPTYLIGVDVETGARADYPANTADSLDQVRTFTNMALDGTLESAAVLSNNADLVGGNVWVPKSFTAGGRWRYYLDTGMIPSTMGLPAANKTFTSGQISVATDQVTISTGDSFNWYSGAPCTLTTGGSLPGGLDTATTYYIRMVNYFTLSFHTTAAGAVANTSRVDITGAGSGTHTIVSTAPRVGWHYRSSSVPIESFSPYGACEILSQIWGLNGNGAAADFYNTWPSWLKQQNDGSFVESNTDYYVQHLPGLIHAVIGGNADYSNQAKSFLVGLTLAVAAGLISRINAAIPGYGTVPLRNSAGLYAVKIMGPAAFAVLTSLEKTATVKLLPIDYKSGN